MKWSNFTIKYMEQYKKQPYTLSDDNMLLNQMKKEREDICKFIKSILTKNPIKITKTPFVNNNDFSKKIIKYAKTDWVDNTNVIKELDNLNSTHLIKWDNIRIIIRGDDNRLVELLDRIEYIVYFIEYLKMKTNKKTPLDIYLVLTGLEKKFPTDNSIVDISTANSGYTDFRENIIFIWRREECEKVLFHELVHFYDLDHKYEDVHLDLNSTETSYHEAITDFKGIYYHLIYLSIITNYPIKKLLEMEYMFIRNQAVQMNTYLELGTWNNINNILIKQNTPAFSYYILKYLLFNYSLSNDINKFISNNNYNGLLQVVLDMGKNEFKNNFNIIKGKSSRMSSLQLE
jgi:hypothetical protein